MMLNSPTKNYPENKQGGLLICGINWGGDPTQPQGVEEQSFFSDRKVNAYPYRSRVVNWFRLFGHPLIEDRGEEGPFERSIIQTNWLPSQSPNVRGKDIINECSTNMKSFLWHLKTLRPRLIIFLGSSLLIALNKPQCITQVEEILGVSHHKARFLQKEVIDNGRMLRRFKCGFQEFQNAEIVALPHPTGAVGLSDKYIEAYSEEIGAIILRFKKSLNVISS